MRWPAHPAERPVYPRVCGGSRTRLRHEWRDWGLSPRVRGKRAGGVLQRRGAGSIPACAGEADGRCAGRHRPPVYPRVCGGSASTWATFSCPNGLSPRVRGKPGHKVGIVHIHRSIPACAGEATAGRLLARIRRVYPRVCGGSSARSVRPLADEGLSPRVRGKLRRQPRPGAAGGSIPACAGEAHQSGAYRQCLWVYPRVCGGSDAGGEPPARVKGLSPRVRGKRAHIHIYHRRRRSIPACAGEASLSVSQQQTLRVYPRVCGGSTTLALMLNEGAGLSPRVRGKHIAATPPEPPRRSIPACAGEAEPREQTAYPGRVYPRVCGGSASWTARRGWSTGLSPRVRGKPESGGCRPGLLRSIPACAGEAEIVEVVAVIDRVYPRVCGGSQRSIGRLAGFHGLSPRVRGKPGPPREGTTMTRSIPACAGEAAGRPGVAGVAGVYPRVCGGSWRR